MRHQLNDVGSLETVASGEDEDRNGTVQVRDLIDEVHAFGAGQLAFEWFELGFGTAVSTRE